MDLVSLKSFLKAGKPRSDVGVRYFQLLLRTIALHAVEADPDEREKFREQIAEIAGRLDVDDSPEALLNGTAAASELIENYHLQAAQHMTAFARELQSILGLLTSTIAFLAASSQTAVDQLQWIEKKLEKAATAEDVKDFGNRVAECLKVIRDESIRVRSEADGKIETLAAGLQTAAVQKAGVQKTGVQKEGTYDAEMRAESHAIVTPSDPYENDLPTDPLTGLPGRPLAKEAVAARIAAGGDFVVALFFMERLDSVRARHGDDVSEDMLLLLAQDLGQNFVNNDSLYRWGGPSFLVILEIQPSLIVLGRRVKDVANAKREKNMGGKSIILPVTCTSMVLRVVAGERPETVFRKLDAFMVAKPMDAVSRP
jgi:GGDEF domain-containing protein